MTLCPGIKWLNSLETPDVLYLYGLTVCVDHRCGAGIVLRAGLAGEAGLGDVPLHPPAALALQTSPRLGTQPHTFVALCDINGSISSIPTRL